MTLQEPPVDVRERDVTADENLAAMEKETSINFPNDTDRGTIYTDVPTMIKWILSVEASDIVGVRLAESGAIIGVKAKIPKGIVKLQGSARKSDAHSQMVSYGHKR